MTPEPSCAPLAHALANSQLVIDWVLSVHRTTGTITARHILRLRQAQRLLAKALAHAPLREDEVVEGAPHADAAEA